MPVRDDELIVLTRLLAKGFVDMARLVAEGAIVRQDEMPQSLRSGMERLSRQCLIEQVEDFGANVHVLMDLACRPLMDWGIPGLGENFVYGRAILIDVGTGLPTDDCIEIGSISSEGDAYEEIHHRKLREAVRAQGRRADEAYTLVRERIVRNPVDNHRSLAEFFLESGLTKFGDVYRTWLRPVPVSAIFPDGKSRTCEGCGSLLYPSRDIARFPSGRCRVRGCIEETPTPRAGRVIDDPTEWRTVSNDVLTSWVGPGLPEIRLFDELQRRGLQVKLYPGQDAVDVGITYELGVDVKSYFCPMTLAERRSRSIGGLAQFDRRIIAIPDVRTRSHRGYLRDLTANYRGKTPVEFMTASGAIEALTR